MSEKTAKKPALGRGLSALLTQAEETYGTKQAAPAVASIIPANQVRRIGVDQLQPGRFQPRRRFNPEAITQLAESIRARGVLQPILARSVEGGKFEIIAGERRWRAAQEAQLAEVPVLVQSFSDAEALEIGLIENLQRADLNALEEADAYQRLIDEFGHTQQALAETIGKSRSHIANTLRLLALPEAIKTMVITERLTPGHARALLNAPHSAQLAETVVRNGLSVRETEKLVASADAKKKPGAKAKSKTRYITPDLAAMQSDLSQRLGLKVQIVPTGPTSGEISLSFTSLDQFDGLLKLLTRVG